MEKPKLILVGLDGNAFAVIGAAQRAASQAKWSPEAIAFRDSLRNKT